MSFMYVARSVKLSKWGADVGVSKHLFKVGFTEESPELLVKDGWAGETDWKLLGAEEIDGVSEDDAFARISRMLKMIDPVLYPKLKGSAGIFQVKPSSVENHILIARALDGAANLEVKVKPQDFADYLINIIKR